MTFFLIALTFYWGGRVYSVSWEYNRQRYLLCVLVIHSYSFFKDFSGYHLKKMNMLEKIEGIFPTSQKLNNWHFLALGSSIYPALCICILC